MSRNMFTASGRSRFELPAFWLLLAYVFVLPFAHSVALRSVFLVLCACGALCVVWRDARRGEWWPGVLPVLLIVWAAWGIVSLHWSVRPDYSAHQLLRELLPAMLAFFCAHALVRTPTRWQCFSTTVLLSAGLYSVAGVAVALWPNSGLGYLLADTGYGSTTLVLALPFFVLALRRADLSLPTRGAVLLGLCLLFLAAYFSANRVFWVCAALLLLVMLFFPRQADGRAFSPGRVLLAGALVALVAYLLLSISMLRGIVPNGGYDIGKVFFEDVRWGIWRQALDLIQREPWLGYGYGRTILDDVLYIHPGLVIGHAHNVWINQTVSLGLPGLVLFVLFSTGFVVVFWRAARGRSGLLREIGLAGFLVCAVFLAKNLTDDFFVRHSGQMFLALCGAALGVLCEQHKQAGAWD